MAAPKPPSFDPAPVARTCRIIAAALSGGVLLFAAIALVIRAGEPPTGRLLSLIAVGFAAFAVLASSLVLGFMAGRTGGVGRTGAQTLYVTRMLIRLAPLEGAAFFNIIVYLVEGNWWSYLAVGALLLAMLASWPTADRVSRFVEDRERLREFGPNGG